MRYLITSRLVIFLTLILIDTGIRNNIFRIYKIIQLYKFTGRPIYNVASYELTTSGRVGKFIALGLQIFCNRK